MTDPAAKPRRGCFFYGCITGLVLLGLVLTALMVGLHYVKKLVNQYTDSRPMELPTVQMSKGEVDQLKQRFNASKVWPAEATTSFNRAPMVSRV